MLASSALQALHQELALVIGAMGLNAGELGKPDLVEKQARQAEDLFQGYAKAKPSKEDAYAAALALMRGNKLSAWQQDLVATAVAEPIREQGGAMVLSSDRFPLLLNAYDEEIKRGDLWRLTWHGLLYSYFNMAPELSKDDKTRTGWSTLRAFLARSWPLISDQAGTGLVPEWIQVLRREPEILSANPVGKYSEDYLSGDTTAVDEIGRDLGIPPSSWFWHSLVLGAVRQATAKPDAAFRELIPQLLALVDGKPGFRDEALELILIRYQECKTAPADERLRDYVCHANVWKNPKLKSAGIATAWNRVPDAVWQMVLGWVNERNLKDFFDILAARNNADEGRLGFWSQYLKQITWTRLVFGADTMALKRSNPDVRNLIAREEGSYAQLLSKPEVDAFMMVIGSYLIVEFSKKPNACYVYQSNQLPFEPYNRHYEGTTEDLAAGFRPEVGCALRIVHTKSWDEKAKYELQRLGIHPDKAGPRRVVANKPAEQASTSKLTSVPTAPPSAPSPPKSPVKTVLSASTLTALLWRYPGASFDDRRKGLMGGRLWVSDPDQRVELANELKALGFKWAHSRQAWYLPEN